MNATHRDATSECKDLGRDREPDASLSAQDTTEGQICTARTGRGAGHMYGVFVYLDRTAVPGPVSTPIPSGTKILRICFTLNTGYWSSMRICRMTSFDSDTLG